MLVLVFLTAPPTHSADTLAWLLLGAILCLIGALVSLWLSFALSRIGRDRPGPRRRL